MDKSLPEEQECAYCHNYFCFLLLLLSAVHILYSRRYFHSKFLKLTPPPHIYNKTEENGNKREEKRIFEQKEQFIDELYNFCLFILYRFNMSMNINCAI